jgi:hypothetical protein
VTSKRIGGQSSRYSFILNSYTDVWVSKCPQCNRLTYARKFPLFIHVEGFGPLVLGKTCMATKHSDMVRVHLSPRAILAWKTCVFWPPGLGKSER